MKLNARFILITFVIVLTISISSTFIFYSLAGRVINRQQSNSILNSSNDFIFTLQNELQKTEEDFRLIFPLLNNFEKISLDSTSIDFVFTSLNDSLISPVEFKFKSNSTLNIRYRSIKKFFDDNPNTVIRYVPLSNGKILYYGNAISSVFLDHIAEKIRAEVALIINGTPFEVSNPEKNQTLRLSIIEAEKYLKYKNNFELYTNELSSSDFVASNYLPKSLITPGGKTGFIIFNSFKEGVEFRDTLQIIMVLLVLAGSALTFIIVFTATAKLRRQIILLGKTAERTGKGDLTHRVPIESKDEVGKLSETFNRMLDELVQNKNAEKEYSEFITLINKNPTLKEISDAALSKIINFTKLTFGVLYIVDKSSLRLISSYGISRNLVKQNQESNFYSNAIEKKEKVELTFTENFPEIKTGITSIKIKYLLIYPVIYNKDTVAVLEFASESTPHKSVVGYLDNIHEQLAVGLVNGVSFEQLENLVNELRKLNEDYLKQNEQITKQNDELKELHHQIEEKAEELDKQRRNAIDLTKVKSEFMASMSHELRTPLISILGLTELLLKDNAIYSNAKDRLNVVHRNGKKLLSLITNILEFSKFETGKIDIKKETFMLNELIDEISLTISQLAADKNLEFNIVSLININYLVECDRAKLEQTLLNLLVNAVKFTEKGSITLQLKIIDDKDVEFSVYDTGIGISIIDQKIIFNEFRQVDGSASRKYGGAGLGLAISKKYVELLGGTLGVESTKGKGSKFFFTIPNIILDTINVEKYSCSGEQLVFVINEHPDSQKLIGDYLNSYNIGVKIFDSVTHLIEDSRKDNPFAIIIDPFLSGANIWQKIIDLRKDINQSPIPIILTIIIEEERLGWEPPIRDYILEGAESKLNEEVFNIGIIGTDRKTIAVIGENEKSIGEYGPSLTLLYYNEVKTLISNSGEENIDAIVIDACSLKDDSFKVIYELSKSRNTRSVPIYLRLPNQIDDKLAKEFNKKLYSSALKIKNHPLDILKILRDRLKLKSAENYSEFDSIENATVTDVDYQANKQEKDISAKPTIMIVDDDNDALFTVGEFIKELNFNPIFAHNGIECVNMLNSVLPELILLDIMMPQMDGFETIKIIKSNPQFKNIPVLALTAYAMLDNKDIIEKNGFNDLITKPINSSVLSLKLNKFLKRKNNKK